MLGILVSTSWYSLRKPRRKRSPRIRKTRFGCTIDTRNVIGAKNVLGDLEIGSQFGPTNPGWHYGTTGTLGGTFSVGLGITRLHVSPTGVVTDSDSIVTLSYGGGAGGELWEPTTESVVAAILIAEASQPKC